MRPPSRITFLHAIPLAVLALALALVSIALADRDDAGPALPSDARELSRLAVSDDPELAERAITALRALGPGGHATLLAEHARDVAMLRDGIPEHLEARHTRLRHAIDVVSGQRHGHASGLYWHTELDTALDEARRRGVPVLSLRLLGDLDQELSCANSRFFRTLLYPDPSVSEHLRAHFVLHWSSERPAPRITIDMGDGRSFETTITGNSVHYVLDAHDGRVIDAIPGLYAPEQFVAALDAALAHRDACAGERDDTAWSACLARRHREALAATERAWQERSLALPGLPPFASVMRASERAPSDEPPTALEAMPLTIGKGQLETPLLRAIAREPMAPPPEPVRWERVTEAERGLASPSPDVMALFRLEVGAATGNDVAREETGLALADGVRNEMTLHARVHDWLGSAAAPYTLEALNARVYDDLFLTPASDPWLGLRGTRSPLPTTGPH